MRVEFFEVLVFSFLTIGTRLLQIRDNALLYIRFTQHHYTLSHARTLLHYYNYTALYD